MRCCGWKNEGMSHPLTGQLATGTPSALVSSVPAPAEITLGTTAREKNQILRRVSAVRGERKEGRRTRYRIWKTQ